MIWDSWSDFFAMGGYALYVWGSIIVVAGLMLGEVLLLTMHRKAILRQLRGSRRPPGPHSMHRKGAAHENAV
ncbi:MAG: heme exporter protein CcmD [Burkholderiales bacterium]